MKTMFDETLRNDILTRIGRVTPESRPRWGKMNAEKMLAHIAESMRMAVGEVTVKPKNVPVRFFPLKQIMLYVAPWPRGLPTSPELLVSNSRSIEANKTELARVLALFAGRAGAKQWPDHPAFGSMTERAWGVLAYRHLDHHLRQFGG